MRRGRGRREARTLAPARQSRPTCVFLLFLSVLGGLRESRLGISQGMTQGSARRRLGMYCCVTCIESTLFALFPSSERDLLFLRADRISPVYYCAAALGWPPTSGSGPQMPPPVLLVLSRASRATLPIHTYIRMHARTCMLHAHARLHACTHVSVHDVVCTHTLHVIHACTYV